jgi:phosphohistidine phosphatase SixA
VSSGSAATRTAPVGIGKETAEVRELKKDHRGLRRRPLFTPLVIAIISIVAMLVIVGWLVLSWGSTTVVLVRHAEKLPDADDPGLSEVGHAHAQRLAEMLEHTGLAAIYVSEARRTQETAAPVAAATDLTPRVVAADASGRLLRRLRWRHRGDVVLVVGHSNTVPVIAEGLGAEIGLIEAEYYSGLWIISYSRLRGTRVLNMRY